MSQSQKMNSALKKHVIPQLTEDGFTGKFPHYRKDYSDRIELISFFKNKYGCSFQIEISVVFTDVSGFRSNLSWENEFPGDIPNDLNVFDTNNRYRFDGMFDGWFYYTDVYYSDAGGVESYCPVGEKGRLPFTNVENWKLVQKADENIYKTICDKVNEQMPEAYAWWKERAETRTVYVHTYEEGFIKNITEKIKNILKRLF